MLTKDQRRAIVRIRCAEGFRADKPKITSDESKLYYATDPAKPVPRRTYTELERLGLIVWERSWTLTDAGRAELAIITLEGVA